MTILLTGGAGYIGSHTIIELDNKKTVRYCQSEQNNT